MPNPYPFVVAPLPAEDLNDAIAGSRVIAVVKTADETVNNSNTPQSDDELTGLAFDIGVNYLILGWLPYTGVDTTADFRHDFATTPGTTGATVSHSTYRQPTSASATSGSIEVGPVLDSSAANSTDVNAGTIAGTLSCWIFGVLFGSTGAGTLTLRWSQATAGVTNLVLERGAWLMLIPIP